MITYHYRCTLCQNEFEIQQSIKEDPLQQCHCCNQYRLERVIHTGLHVSVRSEPKTVGQIADRNTKKMGKYEIEDKNKKYKDEEKAARQKLREHAESLGASVPDRPDEKPVPFYGKSDHDKINRMTEKQKTKFILEGK